MANWGSERLKQCTESHISHATRAAPLHTTPHHESWKVGNTTDVTVSTVLPVCSIEARRSREFKARLIPGKANRSARIWKTHRPIRLDLGRLSTSVRALFSLLHMHVPTLKPPY
jgi:hypothetical protein